MSRNEQYHFASNPGKINAEECKKLYSEIVDLRNRSESKTLNPEFSIHVRSWASQKKGMTDISMHAVSNNCVKNFGRNV